MKKKLLTLAKMLLKFAEINTDKGVLVINDDLAEGIEVSIEKDGEFVPAEDGVYALEDGRTIEIKDGKVAVITEAEAPAEEAPVEAEEVVVETPAETPAEADPKDAKIAELEAELTAKDAEIESLKAKIAEMTAPVEPAVEIQQKAEKKDEKFNEKKYTI